MKKWDKIIIMSLLILSFLPHIILALFVNKEYTQTFAVISVNGEVQKRIPLTGQHNSRDYTITTEYGTNVIRTQNEKIAIIDADCPDKICSEPGFIMKPGQSLVCLPHRLYVGIEGVSDVQDEIDIKAY
ncbi:MAG: NusG domain II-containing protein [Cellulosilyticaceae bacterium]